MTRFSRLGAPVAALAAASLLWLAASPLSAATPSTPEVQEIVRHALQALETAEEKRLGGKCLIALTLLKNGYFDSHPQVVEGIRVAVAKADGHDEPTTQQEIYGLGLTLILLCEYAPAEHEREIKQLVEILIRKQKTIGAWGYPERETGDTSMTQYAIFGLWSAKQSGFDVPAPVLGNAVNWLLRTQDPGGGWAYQGIDAGASAPVAQKVELGCSTAALGSLLIAGEALGFFKLKPPPVEKELPPALNLVRTDKVAGASGVDVRKWHEAIARGEEWLAKNYSIETPTWNFYYLYTLERCNSFREMMAGKSAEEPAWYNEGLEHLKKKRAQNGLWYTSDCGEPVDTSFAVLFLTRSAKKSIERRRTFGDGSLVGGRGLPRNVGDVMLRRGKIVSRTQLDPTADVLKILSDPDHPDFEWLSDNPEEIVLSGEAGVRANQAEHLRRLARSGAAPARAAAIQALARVRDLKDAPLLIEALESDDARVVAAAREGLRFMSRRFQDSTKSPLKPLASDAEVEAWKSWHATVAGGAE